MNLGASYTFQWCHGAPGITLSRLRATELLSDLQVSSEAVAALEATRDAAQAELHTGNYSLCHGLARRSRRSGSIIRKWLSGTVEDWGPSPFVERTSMRSATRPNDP
jgi:Lanthionine synthetase C-like protein